jgi:phosphomannomutase
MFETFHLSPFAKVASQDKPDANFPTVSFPNPEEGAGVWTEAFKVADERGIDVCIANDPDADRFCCAERNSSNKKEDEEDDNSNGDWFIFSGNDLGIMLADWALRKWQKKRQEQQHSPKEKKIAMLTTAVSARVLQSMCLQEGIYFEETLTGFKWLGNRALELEAEGYKVIFAYEEAIGFMIGGTGVVDKDGVAAAALFVDLLNHVYRSQGITLQEHLQGLYTKYGKRLYKQGYFIIDASINADEVFESLRKDYPVGIGGLAVKSIRDMGTGVDTLEDSKVTKLPWSKGDKMITFRFHDNGFCTIRASGTEPKLKYYVDLPLKDEGGNTIDISAVEESISKWLS